MAAPPPVAPPPTLATAFTGLNNRGDPIALGPTWALEAQNVLCTLENFYTRRPGTAKVLEHIKDIFALPDTLLIIDDSDRLLRLLPTGTSVLVAENIAGAPFNWAELGGVAFCQERSPATASAVRQWAIYPDRVVEWGIPVGVPPQLGVTDGSLPAGTYLAASVYVAPDGRVGGCAAQASIRLTTAGGITIQPAVRSGYQCRIYLGAPDSADLLEYATTNAPFSITSLQSLLYLSRPLKGMDCYPPPAGVCLGTAGNQIIVASWDAYLNRSALYFSAPDLPHWFPLTREFLLLPGRVTLLAWHSATATLVIGTDTAIYERVQGRVLQVAAYGALPNTAVLLESGETAFWTPRGLCSAVPLKEITSDRLAPTLRASASAARLNFKGSNYLIIAQQGEKTPSPFSEASPLPVIQQHLLA